MVDTLSFLQNWVTRYKGFRIVLGAWYRIIITINNYSNSLPFPSLGMFWNECYIWELVWDDGWEGK